MQLQLLYECGGQFAPVQPAVGVVDYVIAIVVRPAVIWTCQAVIGQLVIIRWSRWVDKDVLALRQGRAGLEAGANGG